MKISNWLKELKSRSSILYWLGIFLFLISIALLIPLYLDDRTILGINPWIKPIKFSLSVAIFGWTFAWLTHDIPSRFNKWIPRLNWIVGISMIIEMSIIIIQSARGVRSHFNFDTGLDAALFGIMGILILTVTICLFILLILFLFKNDKINKIYLLGIQLGLFIVMLGNYIGQVMISNEQHTVGTEDGGPGVPFFNWSTEGGDLRIAHFLGLHALQIIPLLSYKINQLNLEIRTKKALVILASILYIALIVLLYKGALRGQPLF